MGVVHITPATMHPNMITHRSRMRMDAIGQKGAVALYETFEPKLSSSGSWTRRPTPANRKQMMVHREFQGQRVNHHRSRDRPRLLDRTPRHSYSKCWLFARRRGYTGSYMSAASVPRL